MAEAAREAASATRAVSRQQPVVAGAVLILALSLAFLAWGIRYAVDLALPVASELNRTLGENTEVIREHNRLYHDNPRFQHPETKHENARPPDRVGG